LSNGWNRCTQNVFENSQERWPNASKLLVCRAAATLRGRPLFGLHLFITLGESLGIRRGKEACEFIDLFAMDWNVGKDHRRQLPRLPKNDGLLPRCVSHLLSLASRQIWRSI
jgi:hypothetical protein